MGKVFKYNYLITPSDKAFMKKQRPLFILLTGMSGSGKSSIANRVEEMLHSQVFHTAIIDGDNIRASLNQDLSFSCNDRLENARRVGEVGSMMMDAGLIVICAIIAPTDLMRKTIKDIVGEERYFEAYVKCPKIVCSSRDSKGLHKVVDYSVGDLSASYYDEPKDPDITIESNVFNIDECAMHVVANVYSKIDFRQ